MVELKEYLEEYAVGYSLKNGYEVTFEIVDERHLHIKIHTIACSIFKNENDFTLIGTGGEQKYKTEKQIRKEMKRFFTEN